MDKVLFSSSSDNWSTPQDLFNRLDGEFHFDIDLAADDLNHKCSRYYTKEDDALSHEWYGHCFCNPPYGRKLKYWVEKAYYSYALVVMLLPARTDTSWFHEFIYGKHEVRFIRGRLKFGNSSNSAPFPSMIVVFNNMYYE